MIYTEPGEFQLRKCEELTRKTFEQFGRTMDGQLRLHKDHKYIVPAAVFALQDLVLYTKSDAFLARANGSPDSIDGLDSLKKVINRESDERLKSVRRVIGQSLMVSANRALPTDLVPDLSRDVVLSAASAMLRYAQSDAFLSKLHSFGLISEDDLKNLVTLWNKIVNQDPVDIDLMRRKNVGIADVYKLYFVKNLKSQEEMLKYIKE